jgi:hypothetical protein
VYNACRFSDLVYANAPTFQDRHLFFQTIFLKPFVPFFHTIFVLFTTIFLIFKLRSTTEQMPALVKTLLLRP